MTTNEELKKLAEAAVGRRVMVPAIKLRALLHDLATVTRERDEALADRDKWRSLEREASHYCEIPIALRTNFTGDPPYVGWEGLGLAMTQAFDERDEFLERERKAVAAAAVLGEVRARHQEDERDADRTREQMFDAAIQCFNDRAALLAHIDALSAPVTREEIRAILMQDVSSADETADAILALLKEKK